MSAVIKKIGNLNRTSYFWKNQNSWTICENTIPTLINCGLAYVSVRTFRFFTNLCTPFCKVERHSFKPRRLMITVEKSKKDQHREGNVVYIAKVGLECCPVMKLNNYLSWANLSICRDKDSPLITKLCKITDIIIIVTVVIILTWLLIKFQL